MENFSDFFPKILEENIEDYNKQDCNDYIIAKKYPELRRLKLNSTSKLILKSCNGQNSIADIASYINETFKDIASNTILQDIMDFLYTCWRMDLIKWIGENPFINTIQKNIENYSCKILKGNEVASLINDISRNNKIIYLSGFPDKYSLIEETVDKRGFYTYASYCLISLNKNNILFYELSLNSKKQKSLNFHQYYSEDLSKYSQSYINQLIDWSIRQYENLNKLNFLRIDSSTFTNIDKKYKNNLNYLDFHLLGTLKKHISNNDIDIYYKKFTSS
ncbi:MULTISPECIES: PqqD family peptide modification chaperone [Clostridium]|uniref:PqqD family peptide modification chaperone n=1 Tax=Clostridium TaxID=1485 RepID=UPI0005EE9CF2|nr:PqqD family peptide modification chaperone [Clostridium sporogenes]MCW6085339.1 PqqD family peptide modification chaperone [Clostridium sporogenes]STC74691.1 coenzyme PQQ biosynthesis protein PqqD [Clostridium botulinum]